MIGALVATIVAAWPLPDPPTDNGAACHAWVELAANTLAETPQPPVSTLAGASPEGLVDLPPDVWAELASFRRDRSPDAVSRRQAVLEGRVSLYTAPELVGAATRLERPIRRVLRASLSSRDELPPAVQNWEIFGPGLKPSHLDVMNVIALGNVLGWKAVAEGQIDTALDLCVESWALARALGGTGLIGQMLAVSELLHVRAVCLAAARRAGPEPRRRLQRSLEVIRREWPSLALSLQQELVFAQVAFYSSRWTDAEVARLPPPAMKLRGKARQGDAPDPMGWVRWRVFGGWAADESCRLLAQAARDADGPLDQAGASLRAGASRPLSIRLASDGKDDEEAWIRFARRYRTGRLQLELLLGALEVWAGAPAAPGRGDPRTGKPLRSVGTGPDQVLVAEAVPEREAPELRVFIGEATTSP
jgi:hypothetical protein